MADLVIGCVFNGNNLLDPVHLGCLRRHGCYVAPGNKAVDGPPELFCCCHRAQRPVVQFAVSLLEDCQRREQSPPGSGAGQTRGTVAGRYMPSDLRQDGSWCGEQHRWLQLALSRSGFVLQSERVGSRQREGQGEVRLVIAAVGAGPRVAVQSEAAALGPFDAPGCNSAPPSSWQKREPGHFFPQRDQSFQHSAPLGHRVGDRHHYECSPTVIAVRLWH